MKSNSHPERIALIEFDSSHDECLLTQILALKHANCWVLLVTNKTLRDRNTHLEKLVDKWDDLGPNGKGISGAAIGDALIVRRLMRRMATEKIDRVVFNTGQGGHVRNACLFSLFRKIECVGLIHTTRKLQGSFTQKIISLKIKKYFVLAKFLSEQIPQGHIKIAPFYPIDFPQSPIDLIKDTRNIHVALIGGVESRRKDLDGFISLIKQCDNSVTFSFLGKADPTQLDVIILKKRLAEIGFLDRVKFVEEYIDSETMIRILRKTHAILPLIHPDTLSAKEYFIHQIPGSMNVGLGSKIPLLLHESYRSITELNAASIYYQIDRFDLAVKELQAKGNIIRNTMNSTDAYRTAFQQQNYLDFIFDQTS